MFITKSDIKQFIEDWNPEGLLDVDLVVDDIYYAMNQLNKITVKNISEILYDRVANDENKLSKDDCLYNADILYYIEKFYENYQYKNEFRFEHKIGYSGFIVLSLLVSIIFGVVAIVEKEIDVLLGLPILIGFFFFLFLFINIFYTWTLIIHKDCIEIKKTYKIIKIFYGDIKKFYYYKRYQDRETFYIELNDGKKINTHITQLLLSDQHFIVKTLINKTGIRIKMKK